MPGTFAGFEIANRALRTSQAIIEVIGHNVANVNTPGYSRQTAQLVATEPYATPAITRPIPGQIGTGVDIASITRVRDLFIDRRLRDAQAEQGELTQLRDQLDRVQAAYTEPGTGGISSLLTAFFNRFQELSRNPENIGFRVAVREQAQALAKRCNQVFEALHETDDHIQKQIQAVIEQANNLAQQVATLNREIRKSVAVGDHPNDLMDKRDELVRQLGTLVGATSTEDVDPQGKPTGTVRVFVSGVAIVSVEDALPLPSGFAYLSGTPHLTDGTTPIPLAGGQVAGLIRASDYIATYRGDLNRVASTLITEVNRQHRVGYGLDGGTGRAFFAGTDASNIKVDAAIEADVSAIAAAAPPAPGQTFAAGNGDNARAIADMRNARLIGNLSIGEYYSAHVTQIGADAQLYQQRSDTQEQLIQQMQALRNSVSGVSLDEEVTKMLQYQRSYQAASRFLSTLDSLLENLINEVR